MVNVLQITAFDERTGTYQMGIPVARIVRFWELSPNNGTIRFRLDNGDMVDAYGSVEQITSMLNVKSDQVPHVKAGE